MSLSWSVDLLILKMYWSGIGGKWRSTDHEYVLLWVSTDQCTFTIRISTDQDWTVKRRSTDQYSLWNENLLIMNNVYLNVYWYRLFSAVQCIDPESLKFELLLITNMCSNKCVLIMTDNKLGLSWAKLSQGWGWNLACVVFLAYRSEFVVYST